MTGIQISERSFDRLDRVVRRVESLPSGVQDEPSTSEGSSGQTARVVLLQPLVNGWSALARVTRFQSPPVYDLALFGTADENDTFTLLANGTETDPISVAATAGEMRAALEAVGLQVVSSGLGLALDPATGLFQEADLRGTIGGAVFGDSPEHGSAAFNPGRWLIGVEAGETITVGSVGNNQSMIIRPANWIDSGGSHRVYCAIPLAEPTPLSAGNVCAAQRIDGVLCVTAAEARYWSNPPRI